jgi:hypothetical protein
VRIGGEYSDASERTQDAAKVRRVRPHSRGNFVNSERPLHECIGNAELRRDKQQLRLPISGDALEHGVMRPFR